MEYMYNKTNLRLFNISMIILVKKIVIFSSLKHYSKEFGIKL